VRARVGQGLPREVLVLAAVAFAVAVGFGVVAPAIPVFARHFGVDRRAAGAVISAFAFMRLISALACGRLVDRVGERIVLATGIAIVAVSSALAGLAQSYPQLLVLRGIGGVGSAMFTVSALSLLLRVADADQRGRATGLWQSGFLLGTICGPVLGGPLTAISLRAPFFVYAVTLAAAGAIGMVFLTKAELHDVDLEASRPAERTTLSEAVRVSGYRAALAVNLGTGWTLFGVRSALIPILVTEGLGRSASWTGIGLFASAAAQGAMLLWAGRYADRAGRRPAMILGSALLMAGALLLAVIETLPTYLLAMVILGVGAAFVTVAPSATVGDVAGGRGGTIVAAFGMASDLGAVIGPLVAGQLADSYSFGAGFAVTAAVLAVGLVAAVLSKETRHRAGRPAAGAPATDAPA
jgi:MFS family permease